MPEHGNADYAEGIPVDMYDFLDWLYPDAPPGFLRKIKDCLWKRKLVEPGDFLTPEAPGLITGAFREVLRYEAKTLIDKARELEYG